MRYTKSVYRIFHAPTLSIHQGFWLSFLQALLGKLIRKLGGAHLKLSICTQAIFFEKRFNKSC